MTTVWINNYFNGTDIKVYGAQEISGKWEKLGDPIVIPATKSANFTTDQPGLFITYMATVGIEKPLGGGPFAGGYYGVLDVFDIRAGWMPPGFFASWRMTYLP